MKILLDSDYLFALSVDNDVHHVNASNIIKSAKENGEEFFALNLVIQETATVMSKKRTQKDAITFVRNFDVVVDTVIIFSPEIEEKTWDLFLKQKENKTSFIDCANLVALKEYNLDKIASYDKFYPEKLKLR